jgi:hypothetical protein
VAGCACWPRLGEAPFSPLEQKFLAAGADMSVETVEYMQCMDDMARHVGSDRLGYLLSVPVRWPAAVSSWVVTPWIRLQTPWTPDAATAVLLVQKMLQHRACLNRKASGVIL